VSQIHETRSNLSMALPGTLGALPNAGADVLVFPDGDDVANRVIAVYQDALTDWRYGPFDLAAWVRSLRSWLLSLFACFFPLAFGGKRVGRPEFLFRFEREGARVLGHYVLGRNDAGLRREISINPRHLRTRSERQVAAVLLHELLHWFEETIRGAQCCASRNGYHSAWFRRFAADFGIPCTKYGAELGIVTPSRFSTWAEEQGLRDDIPQLTAAPSPEPTVSKRVPWICACPAGALVTVQVPRGSELRARCECCGELFRRKAER